MTEQKNKPIIEVKHLSKQYQIGMDKTYKRFTESITNATLHPFKTIRENRQQKNTFWALKDIDFKVERGDVLGIIGRNGAGKSTLLKVLSRITYPTEGEIVMRGRAGSLLEVGTGFHPELTGRENIYFNGAILGMKKREIDYKFDEIVKFSGVEKFLDTPVKRYSSGMQVRLAFSVAAHLEPEILIIDEVLAVGDVEFQKKCLGKMGEVASEGRTVLFVSHNMVAIEHLCSHGIVLGNGKIEYIGEIEKAIGHYVHEVETVKKINLTDRKDRQGSKWLTFCRVGIFDESDNEIQKIISGQDIKIRFFYKSSKKIKSASVDVALNIQNNMGYVITDMNSLDSGDSLQEIGNDGFFQCEWPKFNLKSGIYDCGVFCSVNGEIVDWVQSAFSIQVEDGDFYNSGRIAGKEHGDILISYRWSGRIRT
jgi:lipopolysaccharide transport system ATP-binding protein